MIGRTIAHFEITERIGTGGMGEVYRATDKKLGRPVALKLLPESLRADPESRRRLLREAQAASRLNHPNILTIYAVDEADGRDYIAMELIEGESLQDFVSRAERPLQRIINYAMQICEGLARAHSAGITHGDLKPSNILIDREGRVRIVDFGLARDRASAAITRAGAVVGTAAYMSPEQATGRPSDHRSDIFSFGIILFEMVAGQRPFFGEHEMALMYNIVHESPTTLTRIRPDISSSLTAIIDRCLAKDPAARFGDMESIAAELKRTGIASSTGALPGAEVESCGEASIAVLPFEDLSPAGDQAYFCDGLTEELITAFTKLECLRVVARTSVMAFRGKNLDLREIGARLGVGTVLSGSVRADQKRLRVTVQLTNVADGYNLWSERFDRDSGEVFVIQDEITRMVVEALRPRLVGEARLERAVRPTGNVEAYHHYLVGRYHWNKRSREAMTQAVASFEKALALDPKFALAYAGIADAQLIMEDHGMLSFREALSRAKRAALRALELDDRLAEAHTSLATVLKEEGDWEGAEREYLRALELNPGYVTAHHWYCGYLMDAGRMAEAEREILTALQLDPLSLIVNVDTARYYYYARDFKRAIDYLQRAVSIEPGFVRAHRLLYLAYVNVGMTREATNVIPRWLPEYTGAQVSPDEIARVDAAGGFEGVQRRVLDIMKSSSGEYSYSLHYAIAILHSQLGEYEDAISALQRAQQARFPNRIGLLTEPAFDMIRPDPRFARLLESTTSDSATS